MLHVCKLKVKVKVRVKIKVKVQVKLKLNVKVKKNSPVTGLQWPRGFQKVKIPRFHDSGTGWW